ncbi:MAG: hypothetical protein AB8G96_10580 [Phycisphaerales bacterium]
MIGLHNAHKSVARHVIGRETAKKVLSPLLRWDRPKPGQLTDGWSLILGAPWDLRAILDVNLMFLDRVDRTGLSAIHVVFDRMHRDGMDQVAEEARQRWPDLPMRFHHYRGMAGKLVEKIDVSTFYNSMNCSIALAAMDTQYAVLHDFDLYPLRPDHFTRLIDRMRNEQLHFCGVERTRYDGLGQDDNVLGTWGLGMDVGWLRSNWKPIDIFHRVERIRGEMVMLDPFASVQLRTDKRELVAEPSDEDFCHVRNLCSTYLRFTRQQPVKIAWRLHYLWYLEALSEHRTLEPIVAQMAEATSRRLSVDGIDQDFEGVDPTCANVLRDELFRMDTVIHGDVQDATRAFVEGFATFLERTA